MVKKEILLVKYQKQNSKFDIIGYAILMIITVGIGTTVLIFKIGTWIMLLGIIIIVAGITLPLSKLLVPLKPPTYRQEPTKKKQGEDKQKKKDKIAEITEADTSSNLVFRKYTY